MSNRLSSQPAQGVVRHATQPTRSVWIRWLPGLESKRLSNTPVGMATQALHPMRGNCLLRLAVLVDLLASLCSRGIELHRFHRAELTAIERDLYPATQ
jgi:hypothetical protein